MQVNSKYMTSNPIEDPSKDGKMLSVINLKEVDQENKFKNIHDPIESIPKVDKNLDTDV